MTLLEITPVADGAHATLRIQGESRGIPTSCLKIR
ncbi:DUF3251 domain-containing protein [Salmonella enterica subsp. enterica serovar Montevideo]|nr:DUF3251 domain-containing protein [Salmonella enterica subsp. enterica serovar Montevideo]